MDTCKEGTGDKKSPAGVPQQTKAVPGQHVEDLVDQGPEACHETDSDMAKKKKPK